MVAVDELIQRAGGVRHSRIAEASSLVVSTRERRISARLLALYLQLTLLPARLIRTSAPSMSAVIAAVSPHRASAMPLPMKRTTEPSSTRARARYRPMNPDAPAMTTVPLVKEGRPQGVESHAADVERFLVKGTDVEVGSLATPVFVAKPVPDPLAHLVRRSLSGPAEVPVHLESYELLVHVHVAREKFESEFAGPRAGAVGQCLLEVHADVEDDASGAHPLTIEHAEAIRGVVEIAELLHETLRVERPTLRVTGGTGVAAPAVEHRLVVHRLPDLQVVARNALVVHGREFTPGVELCDALGHAPPHAARSREVIARSGVVDTALLGRRDHALQAPDLFGDVEVRCREFLDSAIACLLHPALQRLGAVKFAARIAVEKLDRLVNGCSAL